MRKLMILAMVLAMILGLTPAYAADGSLKLTAEAPDSAGVMYVTLSLSGDITGDTMGLEFSYDKTVLEIVKSGCSWSAKGVLQDINTKRCEGVWAADKSKKLDGSICVLAFRVCSGVTFTSSEVTCSVVVKNGAKQVGEYSDTVTLQKECPHTYGEWTSLQLMGHTRKCTLCGQSQTKSHEWDEGTVTADPTNPGRNIRTRTCTVCKDTRQDYEYVEPTGTSEGRNEHTSPSETVPETTTHVPITMPPTSEEQTYPKPTQPAQTDPEPTTPTGSKPEPTIPTESKPGVTVPTESQPGQAMPTENRPETTTPGQNHPEPTIPTESRPEPTVPTENRPEPTVPTETRPQPTEEGKGEGDSPTAGMENTNPVNPGNPNPETPNTPQSGQIGTGTQQPGQSGNQQGTQQPSQNGNQQQNNTPQQGVIGPGYENPQQNGNPETQATQPGEDPHDHGDEQIGEVHGDHVHLPNGETIPQVIPAPNAPDTTKPGDTTGTEPVETEPAENNRNGLLLAVLLLVWAAAGGAYMVYRGRKKKK